MVIKRPNYSTRDQVVLLRQTLTQVQVAKRLGVSERTVRRWENNEKRSPDAAAPVAPSRPSIERLHKAAHAERVRIKKNNKKHIGEDLAPDQLPILPIATRRTLRQYRQGNWDGKSMRDSDWVNYDVHALSLGEVVQFLETWRGKFYSVQFIFKRPPYPGDPPDVSHRRTASNIETLSDIEDMGGLVSLVSKYFMPGFKLLYVGVLRERFKKNPTRKRKPKRKGK